MKLWGRISSINVRKVVFALEECGVPYDREDAGMEHGIIGTPEFKALNPNNLVPVIDDDGFVLWESNAIVRYIADRYGRDVLLPSTTSARATADAWMEWQVTTLNPALRDSFLQLIRTPVDQRDPALIEASRERMEQALAILDQHLGRHPYIAGNRFSMGDIPVALTVHRWLNLPVHRANHDNVSSWFTRVSARQASDKVFLSPVT